MWSWEDDEDELLALAENWPISVIKWTAASAAIPMGQIIEFLRSKGLCLSTPKHFEMYTHAVCSNLMDN